MPGTPLPAVGFFLVALVYINVLRERTEYGDVEYYIDAALRLSVGQALPNEYFYPPLWATILAWMVPLGENGMFLVVWLLNLISLLAFYFLLPRTLQLYGFTSRFAALATTGFMLANAPILRTMVYMQVNLHVMNAVFLSLLLYRRFPALSALGLALAVHLKASPAVLVLAFLLEWNWRWLAWAALSFLLVGMIPAMAYGFSPYLDFVNNTIGLAAGQALSFRENSFDSFFKALGEVPDFAPAVVSIGAHSTKALLFVATLFVLRKNIKHETFFSGEGVRLYNAIPALCYPDVDGLASRLGASRCICDTLVFGPAKKTGYTLRMVALWFRLLLRVPAADLRLLPLVLRAAGRAVDLPVVDVGTA